ncbi:MAG: Rieske (2Fe-2S) protein [Candidatus Competibacteraceae bacterium]|nr:Rieske (2Fe-2S) protein [Candidatus Competibacteraceae bacterium]
MDLGPLEAIPDGGSRGVSLNPRSSYADLILVRRGQRVWAYHNRCPHTGAPMEWEPDRFMDYTGRYIQCGLHAALFRVEDGYCIAGPCARRSLEPLRVEVRRGRVVALEDAGSLGWMERG